MSKRPPSGVPIPLPFSDIGNEALRGDFKIADGPAPVVRGENPRPADGWSWHLTDYEIAYALEYNVRPVRGVEWSQDPATESRLDQEADGVRNRSRVLTKPRRQLLRWPFAMAFAILVLGSVAMTWQGIVNVHYAIQFDEKTHSVANPK